MMLYAKLYKCVPIVALALWCGTAFAATPKTVSQPDSTQCFVIHFRCGESVPDSTYMNNAAVLRRLKESLGILSPADTATITASSSPDGSAAQNALLARRRAENLKKYIVNHYPGSLTISALSFTNEWKELLPLAGSEQMIPLRDKVITVLSQTVNPATTQSRLRQIGGGEAWRYIRSRLLPQLRTGTVFIHIRDNFTLPADAASGEFPNDWQKIMIPAFIRPDDSAVSINRTRLPELPQNNEYSANLTSNGVFAIKSNLLGLAAGIANIGVEFRLGKKLSLDLPFYYSPYTIAQDYRLRILALNPELRYWFSVAFQRHFLGVHANCGIYNVSLFSGTRYQSDRMAYGAGVSWGYFLPVSKCWAVEFSVGAGIMNTSYECYHNVRNGLRYDSNRKQYRGITRASVNIVWVINRSAR